VKIATWNVNGIRAREAQLEQWIARERPEVLCLQEIKATPDQIPSLLCELQGYWCYYHGTRGYSGVALHVRKDQSASRPTFTHPDFDFESRIAAVELGALTVASVYVPNGGKDLPAKLRFLGALGDYAAALRAAGRTLVLAGDLNVARTDRDVHPSERKPAAIGQLPEERAALETVISHGLVDVARQLDPDNDRLFTWWAPWRNLRQRNVGWRIDYLLASQPLAARASACVSQREFGTSDHAPLMATFDE
jgi:exodeoxyribonuclease-3